jgi:hypothetical protein
MEWEKKKNRKEKYNLNHYIMKYINKTNKLLVVKIDQYRLIFNLNRKVPITSTSIYLICEERTWSEVIGHTDFYISIFLPTKEKKITSNPNLQFVWHAFDDKSKMAYLPANKVKNYDHNNIPSEAYLRKYGKMLSYNKFVEKFHTTHFEKGYNLRFEVREDVTHIYSQNENIGSCMSNKSFLTDMYEEVGCNILTAWNGDEVYGRAIVWKNHELVSGEKNYPALLDRCYAVDNTIKDLMGIYAKEQGWDVRRSNCSYYDEFESGNKYRIPIRKDNIPWLDTFRQGMIMEGKPYATNDAYENGITLQDTDGSCLDTLICHHCGCEIIIGEEIKIDGYSYCQDCTVYSEYDNWILIANARQDIDGNWFSKENDNFECVDGNWYYNDDRRIRWDGINNEYILRIHAVFVESENCYTHEDNVVVCKECGANVLKTNVNEDGLCRNCIKVKTTV